MLARGDARRSDRHHRSYGAGKSTLLKVLSRIFDRVRERSNFMAAAASLLEVGTGFLPIDRQREYLLERGNSGDKRREINARFDEIGGFCPDRPVSRPVKRYSTELFATCICSGGTPRPGNPHVVKCWPSRCKFSEECLGKMDDGPKCRTVLL